MADRFLLKKFASETNDVGQFGSFQSTGGKIGNGVKTTDPDLIQSLPAWKAGWGNAVDNGLLLPRLEEMNGVQRVFAEMLWNQWRDGLTFWQAGAPVKALQSVVVYQSGDEQPKIYINQTGVNGENPPPQDTENWKPLSDFFVTTDTAQTITGVKTFTETPIVPTPPNDAEGQEAVNAVWVKSNSGSGRNVGDVFYTSRTDAELNGAFECNGAQHNIADFNVGTKSVSALLAAGNLPYVSIEAFDAAVAANGSCRCFGWDGADATVFKVPKLNDVYIQAGTAASAGEFISESLPNPNSTLYSYWGGGQGNSGNQSIIGQNYSGSVSTASDGIITRVETENSTYQDSAKVRPDSVRYRPMIQLANSTTDEALATVTSVLGRLSALENAGSGGNFDVAAVFEAILPDWTAAVSITLDDSIYNVPDDGWLSYYTLDPPNKQIFMVNNKLLGRTSYGKYTGTSPTEVYDSMSMFIPVKAGDKINMYKAGAAQAYFYPYKGVSG